MVTSIVYFSETLKALQDKAFRNIIILIIGTGIVLTRKIALFPLFRLFLLFSKDINIFGSKDCLNNITPHYKISPLCTNFTVNKDEVFNGFRLFKVVLRKIPPTKASRVPGSLPFFPLLTTQSPI